MKTVQQEERSTRSARAAADLGRAWIASVLIPAFFLPALALGYLLYDLAGYKPENDDAPVWVDLACTVPALALFLVPCVAAVVYGRRARSGGERLGLVPTVLGAVAGLWFVALTLIDAFG